MGNAHSRLCPLQMAAVGRANSNRKPEVLVFGRKAVFLWDVENFMNFMIAVNRVIVWKCCGSFRWQQCSSEFLWKKISRVKTAGRKMIGRGQAWYAAAWADWRCETGYGSVRSAADAGTGHNGVTASGTEVCRNRWGYACRGRKTVTDKVDVGNNPRDGNVCWKYLSRGLSRCKLRNRKCMSVYL